jgi:hypothetical protein
MPSALRLAAIFSPNKDNANIDLIYKVKLEYLAKKLIYCVFSGRTGDCAQHLLLKTFEGNRASSSQPVPPISSMSWPYQNPLRLEKYLVSKQDCHPHGCFRHLLS